MVSIFPLLVSSLQTKLAQYALLTHRAAVLAALPTLPTGKGVGTRWASEPAPKLLKAVVHFAGQPGSPKVARLLLRVWFQKKTELRAVVYQALEKAGYPLPPLAEMTEPCPWNVPLGSVDVLHQGEMYFFYPAGQRISGADEASLEEISLMAHLLGWSILSPVMNETPPGFHHLHVVAGCYTMVAIFRDFMRRLTDEMPADLPLRAEVLGGALPDEAAAYWSEDWPQMRDSFAKARTTMQEALADPLTPPEAILTLSELESLLRRLQRQAVHEFVCQRYRQGAENLLTQVESLRHRQQPDFAPLAALRERTAAVRTNLAAGWPEGKAVDGITQARLAELLNPASAYRLLLQLVENPAALDALDEASEDFQELEAALPSGVLNALLLRKLTTGH